MNRLAFRGGPEIFRNSKILLHVTCGVGLGCILERSPLHF